MAKESFVYTMQEGRKTLNYKDVAKAIHSITALEFLEDIVPFPIPMRTALANHKPSLAPPSLAPKETTLH